MSNLFIGGLPWHIEDQALRTRFEEFGVVEKAVVVKDHDTGRSRGFGFVRYQNESDARTAMQMTDSTELEGRQIRVDLATERTNPGGARGGAFGAQRGGYRGGHSQVNAYTRGHAFPQTHAMGRDQQYNTEVPQMHEQTSHGHRPGPAQGSYQSSPDQSHSPYAPARDDDPSHPKDYSPGEWQARGGPQDRGYRH